MGSLFLGGLDVGTEGMLVTFDCGNGIGGVLGYLCNGEGGPCGEEVVTYGIGPCGDSW